jgi:CO dehydrogenase/acetyl-CoA synthase delta subunit
MLMNTAGNFSVSSRYSTDDISGDRKIYQININQRHLFERTLPQPENPSVYIDGYDQREIDSVVRNPIRQTYVDKMRRELNQPK